MVWNGGNDEEGWMIGKAKVKMATVMKQYNNGNGRKMKDQLYNKPSFILSNFFLTKIREY